MDMKKRILLSMILLALCLIQASADEYYYQIRLYDEEGNLGDWSDYIKVVSREEVVSSSDGQQIKKQVYDYGLRWLIDGKTVTDKGGVQYTLPQKDLNKIWGIKFANKKGRDEGEQSDIMWGDEYTAWTEIREHIQYLGLRYYKRDTYTGDNYFANMHKVEELELPKDGMTLGDEVNYMYFANADNLKKITICIDENKDPVDITAEEAKGKVLLNKVGSYMFSNCYKLSTKYINRLIKDVTEIKNNAFSAGNEHRKDFLDEADNKMAIEIPSSVTKIGDQAFWNRVKVTGLNIQGNGGSLAIGSEAFKGCDELNVLNMDNAKITHLGTGVFRECRSMTKEFVK